VTELLKVSDLFAVTAGLEIVGWQLPQGLVRQHSIGSPAPSDVETHTSQ
jgi:hypothetical protein